jgi:hypothetical protein
MIDKRKTNKRLVGLPGVLLASLALVLATPAPAAQVTLDSRAQGAGFVLFYRQAQPRHTCRGHGQAVTVLHPAGYGPLGYPLDQAV